MQCYLLSFSALFLFNLSLFSTSATISESYNTKAVASSREYCIAWDIHGVLVQFNWQQALRHVSIRSLASFLTHFSYNFALKSVGKVYDNRYEDAVREVLTLAKAEVSWQGFSDAFRRHGFKDISQSIKHIGLSYDIMPGILPIIEQLQTYGYRQYVASNIGSDFYYILREKHPELFKNLNGGLTIAMDNMAEKINSHTDVPRKPNPAFFALLRTQNKIPDTVNILFIDDREYYIKGAQTAAGFIPIHFRSVNELKDALTKHLGVLFTQ